MTTRGDTTRPGHGDPADPATPAPNPAPAGNDAGGPADGDDAAQPSWAGRQVLRAQAALANAQAIFQSLSRGRKIAAGIGGGVVAVALVALGVAGLAYAFASGDGDDAPALAQVGGNSSGPAATPPTSTPADVAPPAEEAPTAPPSQGGNQAATPPPTSPPPAETPAPAEDPAPAPPSTPPAPPTPATNPAPASAVLPVTSDYPVQGVATVTNAENATIAVAPGGMSISGPSQVQLIQTPPDGTGGAAGIPVATLSDGVGAAQVDYRGQPGVQHELVDLGDGRFAYRIRGNARVTLTPANPSQAATPSP